MNSKTKLKLLVLLTSGIFFAFMIVINNNFHISVGNTNNQGLNTSKTSGKIHIIGNSGWVDFKNAGNCTGSGSYSDPYIIKDLVINAGDSGSCIWIENSNIYFKIENCTVYNSGSNGHDAGIRLSKVSNSKLTINAWSFNYVGIFLDNCYNNSILKNIVNDNTFFGISLIECNNNTISGNVANVNCIGILLGDSNNNIILGNNASYNFLFGISLYYCDYNYILNNNASSNLEYGIYLSHNIKNFISHNIINKNNEYGIYLVLSHNNTISYNIINENDDVGLYLETSFYNNISGNVFIGNYYCWKEDFCVLNNFENNTCVSKYKPPSIDYVKIFLFSIALPIFIILIIGLIIRLEKKDIKNLLNNDIL